MLQPYWKKKQVIFALRQKAEFGSVSLLAGLFLKGKVWQLMKPSRRFTMHYDDSLYEKWTDFSLRHFPKDKKKLLELACGTGIQSIYFKAGWF